MNEDFRQLVEHYRDQAAILVPNELYRLARTDGVSSAYAGAVLRSLFGLGMSECLQVMRDCGDDPLDGTI